MVQTTSGLTNFYDKNAWRDASILFGEMESSQWLPTLQHRRWMRNNQNDINGPMLNSLHALHLRLGESRMSQRQDIRLIQVRV